MAVRKSEHVAAAWQFRLYICDHSPRSLEARSNLDRTFRTYLQRGYEVRIIDIHKSPAIAARDNILAIPTLKRIAPGPERTMIGSLSDTPAVLKWLGLKPAAAMQPAEYPLSVQQQIGRA